MKVMFLLSLCLLIPTLAGKAKVDPVKDKIVRIAPVDNKRVAEITSILNDQLSGFGQPYWNRETWDKLKSSGKYNKVLKEADRIVLQGIPGWDEDLYMGMFTRGDSQSGKDMLSRRIRALVSLVWAECLTNESKYIGAVEQALKEIINQKTWVNPRNYNEKNFDGLVELSTASYSHTIAQTLYLLDDKLKSGIRDEAINALYKRAFEPLLRTIQTKNDDHGWLTGTNNWNAVCLSGVTCAALLVIPSKEERAVFVSIAERYIKNFVAGFLDDGYCTEGLSYFNYGFGRYTLLRESILKATNGKIDLFSDNPKIANIARFLPNMEIINGIYPAIADCRQYSKPSSGILRYLSWSLGEDLPNYGSIALEGRTNDLQEDLMHAFPYFQKIHPSNQPQSPKEYKLRSWFDVAGVLTVRPERTHPHSMGATLKGGNNQEHHNHNDLGSFTIVVGNEILAGDPGLIPYTAKTFSSQRYEYKTLGSYGHPVPLISGKQQRQGAGAMAEILLNDFTPREDVLKMDLSSAYEIPGIKHLTREFRYSRGETEKLQVTDQFEFSSPELFETALITRGVGKVISDSQLLVEGKTEKMLVTFTSNRGDIFIESEEINEDTNAPYSRIAIRIRNPVKNGKLTVLFSPVR